MRLLIRCLAHHDYSAVHIPTEHNEQVKEYIRMRQNHKLALKQQILSFCLGHNYRFEETKKHWTAAHINWLRPLKPDGIYKEILEEYFPSISLWISWSASTGVLKNLPLTKITREMLANFPAFLE